MIDKNLIVVLIVIGTLILAVLDRTKKAALRTRTVMLAILLFGLVLGITYVLGIKYGYIS